MKIEKVKVISRVRKNQGSIEKYKRDDGILKDNSSNLEMWEGFFLIHLSLLAMSQTS